ncbi:CGH_3_HP_G0021310.mRNA.1.CDS.1 [Saccharomyces cerevisiae]|nr:CGH_1_HP_G0006850.mRNA.1.CDS.1 [Saccharomyces cerevisiae]CAI4914999.1 CGH_3_HP_G0021310.mRNA.1.CDS.1 [Saccharomyces cerevisiae]CAI4952037.1 CGH_1_HP_G0038540.mRNA.1.CDS.1 [Saccharomyces cerevisiae]CAI6380967.1 CGH_1_HP_G0006850.mRNA.1.CDS.1 [Saccharomyces cerevisiae]CAI6413531.1 CGH_3_HP_G0021310.mRNA.1.CDS.1 [Saccharomyces cerevisiae]
MENSMMFISRSLRRPVTALNCNLQSVRTVIYLHKGPRINGLRRDPESYLRNPSGVLFTEVNAKECQDKVRSILQLPKYGINLSNELILQCLTHKSFAHGSKPYNEKLNLLGAQFLKLQTSIHSLKNGSPAESCENGQLSLQFSNLGTKFAKELTSKNTACTFVKLHNLGPFIFWKMRDPIKDGHINGETTIFASVLNAFIGAILSTNGSEKAAKFIQGSLLDKEDLHSLVNIANENVASGKAKISDKENKAFL